MQHRLTCQLVAELEVREHLDDEERVACGLVMELRGVETAAAGSRATA